MTHTIETIKMTQESYYEAISKLFEISPSIRLHGGGYTYYMGENFDACSIPSFEFANGVYVQVEDLFDFGRPKIINKQFHIYQSSFFRMRLSRSEEYKNFHMEPKRINEDGTETPHKIIGQPHKITLWWHEQYFGLGKWSKNIVKIKEIANSCITSVRDEIIKHAEKADEKVAKWKTGIMCACDILED